VYCDDTIRVVPFVREKPRSLFFNTSVYPLEPINFSKKKYSILLYFLNRK
jgi:hypothetical protein